MNNEPFEVMPELEEDSESPQLVEDSDSDEPPELIDVESVASIPESSTKVPPSGKPTALYLFAGEARRAEVGQQLRNRGWMVQELDILRDKAHDFSIAEVASAILEQIKANHFMALLVSPPCDTFTRVKYANNFGPKPERSSQWPRGFPWLEDPQKRQVRLANSLTDFTLDAIECQIQNVPGLLALEFPEDLGAVTSGEWTGIRPASIFQFPRMQAIMSNSSVLTGALRQQDYGTPYIKPTRLVLRLNDKTAVDDRIFLGLPSFDDGGYYLGPLPYTKSTHGLAKTADETGFRTTGTAAWPEDLCESVASMLDHSSKFSEMPNHKHIAK